MMYFNLQRQNAAKVVVACINYDALGRLTSDT